MQTWIIKNWPQLTQNTLSIQSDNQTILFNTNVKNPLNSYYTSNVTKGNTLPTSQITTNEHNLKIKSLDILTIHL
jgi:hypothetical protein